MAVFKYKGKEYKLRLDLEVLEHMEEECGGMRQAFEKMNAGSGQIKLMKQMFTWMVNAANDYDDIPERVTGDELRHMDMGDYAKLSKAIQAAAQESTHAETIHGGEADRDSYDGYLAEIEEEEKKK